MNTKQRFESYFTKTETCWNWQKALSFKGYGTFVVKKQKHAAHRFSYRLYKSEIPEGLFVCHSCDNRACVNPSHLFLGTAKDNTQDMIKKGRQNNGAKKGDESNNRKLTSEDVFFIRESFGKGVKELELAKRFNCTRQNITRIIKRITWNHI